jgi:hypothetical protein
MIVEQVLIVPSADVFDHLLLNTPGLAETLAFGNLGQHCDASEPKVLDPTAGLGDGGPAQKTSKGGNLCDYSQSLRRETKVQRMLSGARL